MSRNGSGTYSLPSGNPVVSGTTITDTWANTTLSDIASGLTGSIAADGQTPITANLPMSNFKLTGLAAGNATGNSLRWEQLFSQGAPTVVASAATVDIGSYNTNAVEITGTTDITSLGTNYNGPRYLRFTGALVLTYNATTLVTPTGASITTAAGDTCVAYPTSAGTGWNIFAYQRASGSALVVPTDYLNTTRTNVASASTLDLTANAPSTRNIAITGTATITAVTVAAGQTYFVKFTGVSALTNNAAIVTNTGANITTASGDSCILRATAADTVEVLCYVPANWNQAASTSVIGRVQLATAAQTQAASSTTLVVTPSGLASLLPKFWCNFDGTASSPITIRAGYNVTNVTRTGTGVFEINLTNALTSVNFAVSALGGDLTAGYGCMVDWASCTTSKIVVNTYQGWGAAASPSTLMVTGFGA